MKTKIRTVLELAKKLCSDMEAEKNRKNHPDYLEVQLLKAVEEAERELALLPVELDHDDTM